MERSVRGVRGFAFVAAALAAWAWPAAGAAGEYDQVYATTYGGISTQATAIAVDASGAAWVAGPYNTVDGAWPSDTLVRLDPSGTFDRVVLAGWTGATDVAIDARGKLHVIGLGGAVPTPDAEHLTGSAWYARLDATGQVEYATYLPGLARESGAAPMYGAWASNNIPARSLAVDAEGNVYVAGKAYMELPTTAASIQPAFRGGYRNDCAVWKLDASGRLAWATYLGGTGEDQCTSVAVGPDGSPFVAGLTQSSDFPVTAGAYRTSTPQLDSDAFVAKLSPWGERIVWSTLLGETANVYSWGSWAGDIAVDAAGRAWVGGSSTSGFFECRTTGTFGNGAWIVALSPDGASLPVCRDFHGQDGDLFAFGRGVAVDARGDVFFLHVMGDYNAVDKLDPTGRTLDRKSGGGYFSGYFDSFAVDSQGSAYLAGWYRDVYTGNQPYGRVAKVHPSAAPDIEPLSPFAVPEGSTIPLHAIAVDREGDPVTYRWDLDNGSWIWERFWYDFEAEGQTVPFTAVEGPATWHVAVLATDSWNSMRQSPGAILIENVPPSLGAFAVPAGGVQAGAPFTAALAFADPGVQDLHSGEFTWGDGTASAAQISEAAGFGTAAAVHAWAAAGFYDVTAVVADDDGGASQVEARMPVFDPAAGALFGHGPFRWAGGNAVTDFEVGYGSAGLVGTVELQISSGGSRFAATALDWLVVIGGRAYVSGSGTLDGRPGHAFLLAFQEGTANGGDKIRLRIWDPQSGVEAFDTQPGAPLLDAPTTPLGGGAAIVR